MAIKTYMIPPDRGPYKRNALFHFINGINSDIPLCCSFFFARKVMDEKCHKGGIAYVVTEERDPGSWDKNNHDAPYVQCDKCYENNHVVEINDKDSILWWLHKDEYDE